MSSSGWVKMKDPSTGMDYYANRITRQTQWEVPPGFVDESAVGTQSSSNSSSTQYNVSASGFGSFRGGSSNNANGTSAAASTTVNTTVNTTTNAASSTTNAKDNSLPPNWEKLFDQSSGKYFYVDHVNKVTTWEPPVVNRNQAPAKKEGMATGFGIIPKSALERSTHQGGSSGGNSRSAATRGVTSRDVSRLKKMSSHPNTTSATSPSWQYYGSNPPPSTTMSSSISKAHSSSSIHQNDDMSTKYYNENHIDFTVQIVPDRLRAECASSGIPFSLSVRRHHCRVCQDIFCHEKSAHKVSLPFEGEEFTKPVRVCDLCFKDVENGNFFSMRRYLTPLQLYDGEDIHEGGIEFTSRNVCAALSALSRDFESLLLDSTSFTEKVTIPCNVLVPAICKHLKSQDTCDYAIRALSVLLSLGNVVGDTKFAIEVYAQEYNAFEDIMTLLEWGGSSTKTLALQEQTAQTLFYLTDAKLISEILRLGEDLPVNKSTGESWSDGVLGSCDIHRMIRSFLDHTTQTMSPSLQRWSAACICNLIAEDYRRSCNAIEYAMAMGSTELKYESFTMELVTSGGVMILSSLVSSDDSDTRNYAMKALSATIETSRDLNVQLGVLKEAYGIQSIGNSNYSDTGIIDGIVSAGACSPLTQLLLSGDDSVASMGCNFARSLVHPLLTNPLGSSLPCYHRLLSVIPNTEISSVVNEDGLGAYRNAAFQMASNEEILSALLSLICAMSSRPIDLKRSAMEVLVAMTLSVSFLDSKVKAMGTSIEGNPQWEELKQQIDMTVVSLEEEGVSDIVSAAFSSASVSSLNTSRDSAATQLKEAASLVMTAIAASSPTLAASFMSSNIVAKLISTAADDGYATASARGEWTSRRLTMLEAIAMILVQGWKSIQIESCNVDGTNNMNENGNPLALGLLLESLDAGIIPLLSRLLDSRLDVSDPDRAYADIRLKIAINHIIGALFGIGQCDASNIGFARIFEALGNTHYLIPSAVALLGSTIVTTQQGGSASTTKLPIPALLEASLIALGSMCGSRYCSFNSVGINGDKAVLHLNILSPEDKDVFSCQFEEICISTCEMIAKNSFLASCLVGAYGEGSIMPIIRLASAIGENGPESTHQMLARSGILSPIADMLRDALVSGDYYVFTSCLSLVSVCGPQPTSNSENSGIQSLRGCVQMLANVLTIDEGNEDSSEARGLAALKRKCIFAIERLSNNNGLWVTIVNHFIPCVSEYLLAKSEDQSSDDKAALSSGLRVVLRVISLPAHAMTIANTGLGASLSNLVLDFDPNYSSAEVEVVALQILHSLVSTMYTNQISNQSLEMDALNASCSILSREIDGDTSNAARNTKLALDITHMIVADLENIDQVSLSTSPRVTAFVETISIHSDFMCKLCATLLNLGDMNENSKHSSIQALYGPSILLFEGLSGAFDRSLDSAMYLLFRISFFCALVDSVHGGEEFWQIFFLENQKTLNVKARTATTTTSCAIFLSALVDEEGGLCVPLDKSKLNFYINFSLPLVRERLLNGLHSGVEEFAAMKDDPSSVSSLRILLEQYKIPQSCLALCNSTLMIDSAFQVLEIMLAEFSDILVESVVTDSIPLVALFNLLSVSAENTEVKTKPEMIRIFAAVTLSAAGKLGILGPAVKRHGLRSLAVASLSASCLMEDQDSLECIAEDLTSDGASISTLCLRGLVDVLSVSKDKKSESLEMSPSEAKAISSALGKKLSSMVLDHFVKRESGDLYGAQSGGEIDKLPEVVLICSLAAFKDSLYHLCSQGGLEALSLVAAEGLRPAISALHEACKIDAKLVLDVDGHLSAMQVIADDGDGSDGVKADCMQLLGALCCSKQGKQAISDSEEAITTIEFASDCIVEHSKEFMEATSDNDCDLLSNLVEKPQTSPQQDTSNAYENELTLASLTFLSSIARVKESRLRIIQNEKLKETLSSIFEKSPSPMIKFAIASLLSSLARYSKDFTSDNSCYSVENMFLMIALAFSPKQIKHNVRSSSLEQQNTLFGNFSKSHQYNDNLMHATACEAFEHMLSNTPENLVHELISILAQKLSDTVTYEMKTSKKIALKTRNSGLLVFNITSILRHCATRMEFKVDLTSQNVLTEVLRIILLNPAESIVEGKKDSEDDKRAQDEERKNWDCSVTNCLQFLSSVSIDPDLSGSDVSSWDEILSTVENEVQFYKKGKRKLRLTATVTNDEKQEQVTVVSTLNKYVNDGQNQSASAVAAGKILTNLDL